MLRAFFGFLQDSVLNSLSSWWGLVAVESPNSTRACRSVLIEFFTVLNDRGGPPHP